ncbi:hypothetical protein ELE36_04175 [Pseudolysobacter antarcticus]|uniref:Glycosyltransferase RgtA/B/C/D-like domain-containing protein n=1 Tax=Pseudolysobacter antarcticus TaxID=2511995 RepID=A0A411HGL2_9GAMM|nr:hypothetical protein [Pseudolysobacter antarcticus]QBB69638.1 hypothetical protein ELE36_04175 [Pseudolysobacter antarcticus]
MFSQLWAMAPWAGDIVQSVAQLSAGQEARGAVDAFWLLASAALLWRLATTMAMPPYARWLASALYLSLPMTSALAGGMQAELPATTILLALALAVAEAPARPDVRVFCSISMLAALMLAIKTGFLAATIPIGIWLLIRWRGRVPARAILPALVLVIFIAASSYVYAYLISGNPMLPLFNGIFHSPLIPQDNFSGTPYKAGGGITSPWLMTFHTHLFSECWDGAAGMSFLGLIGASIAALFMRKLRPLALVATVAFLIPFEAINYYRYAYPALVLMIPVTVAAASTLLTRRTGITVLTMMIGLNLLYQGCSYYTLHDATFLKHKTWSKEKLFKRFAPERSIAEFIRQHSDTDTAVLCDPGRPFYAELAGRGLTISSYDTELSKLFVFEVEQDPNGNAWRGLFAKVGARYAVTTESKRSPALTAALSDASKIRQIGAIELWLLPVTTETSNLLQSRDLAAMKFRP